jgi:hypothetical protein
MASSLRAALLVPQLELDEPDGFVAREHRVRAIGVATDLEPARLGGRDACRRAARACLGDGVPIAGERSPCGRARGNATRERDECGDAPDRRPMRRSYAKLSKLNRP